MGHPDVATDHRVVADSDATQNAGITIDGDVVHVRLKGAFHSSDLWFVFKSLKHCWRPWTKGDWDLSEKMLTAWTNFVKYSDPNGPQGGAWAPCTAKNTKFMVFKLDDKDAEASYFGDPEIQNR